MVNVIRKLESNPEVWNPAGPKPVGSAHSRVHAPGPLPLQLNLRMLAAATAAGMRGPGGGIDADDSALSDMMSPRSVMSDEVAGTSPPASDDEEESQMMQRSDSRVPLAVRPGIYPGIGALKGLR